MLVKIKRLSNLDGLPLPSYKTNLAVGLDLAAAIPNDQLIILEPGQRMAVPTGICIELPIGCEGQVRPRSGCSLNDGLVAILGTIDGDYRGEIKAIVCNIDQHKPITINRGDRIAQLVVAQIEHISFEEVQELSYTKRGDGGFGSTGKK